jgi:hypothetical protein
MRFQPPTFGAMHVRPVIVLVPIVSLLTLGLKALVRCLDGGHDDRDA